MSGESLVSRYKTLYKVLRPSLSVKQRVMRSIYWKRSILPLVFGCLLLVIGCNVAQDKTDAEAVATRINSQLQIGDFASIYRESSQSFKQVGNEAKFVAGMELFHKENGDLRKITPIAYQTGVDSKAGRTHVLIFQIDCDRGGSRERMVLTRSQSGRMELWDLALEPIS